MTMCILSTFGSFLLGSVSASGGHAGPPVAVVLLADASQPFVGRVVAQDGERIRIEHLPEGLCVDYPRERVARITTDGDARFKQYLDDYAVLSRCLWVFLGGKGHALPGVESEGADGGIVLRVLDGARGWTEVRDGRDAARRLRRLNAEEIVYLLGPVPEGATAQAVAGASDDVPDAPSVHTCQACGDRGYQVCPRCLRGRVESTCGACNGQGRVRCPGCGGVGSRTCSACGGSGSERRRTTTGARVSRRCGACGGSGMLGCGGCYGRKTVDCTACVSGKVMTNCSYCGGRARIPCAECPEPGSVASRAAEPRSTSEAPGRAETSPGIASRRVAVLGSIVAAQEYGVLLEARLADAHAARAGFEASAGLYELYMRGAEHAAFRRSLGQHDRQVQGRIWNLYREGQTLARDMDLFAGWAQGVREDLAVRFGPERLLPGGEEGMANDRRRLSAAETRMGREAGKAQRLTTLAEELAASISGEVDAFTLREASARQRAQMGGDVRRLLGGVFKSQVSGVEVQDGALQLTVRFRGDENRRDLAGWSVPIGDALFPHLEWCDAITLCRHGAAEGYTLEREQWRLLPDHHDQDVRDGAVAGAEVAADAVGAAAGQAEDSGEEASEGLPMVLCLLVGLMASCGLLLVVLRTGRAP